MAAFYSYNYHQACDAFLAYEDSWATHLAVGKGETSDRKQAFANGEDNVLRNLKEYVHSTRFHISKLTHNGFVRRLQ